MCAERTGRRVCLPYSGNLVVDMHMVAFVFMIPVSVGFPMPIRSVMVGYGRCLW